MEAKSANLRHVATKVAIKNVIEGQLKLDQEQNYNYLLTPDNQKLYRINIVAIIVQKEKIGSITNLLLDDGSAKIIVRSFEPNKNIEQLTVGNAIIVIGKVRIYNTEIYISPEICKKIDSRWLKVRANDNKIKSSNNNQEKEGSFKDEKQLVNKETINPEIEKIPIENETTINEPLNQEESMDEFLPFQKLTQIIKELDPGEGVPIEVIIEKSDLEDAEKLLKKMLEKGDIFQNQPGKVKIL